MLMSDPVKVYWDACAWLGLINGEEGKKADLEFVWSKAQHGEAEIWTSAFCIAEVYRRKCEQWDGLSVENDALIDSMFDQNFVKVVQLDMEIARLAKSLLRAHDKLKKPSDAIHLATAVHWDVAQLHTYDSSDLIGLNVQTADGSELTICKPSKIDGENLFNREAGG